MRRLIVEELWVVECRDLVIDGCGDKFDSGRRTIQIASAAGQPVRAYGGDGSSRIARDNSIS
jgi:hypothetical protein